MMEAASTSETSVNFYQATRRINTEDSHLHTRRRENLKSQQLNAQFRRAQAGPWENMRDLQYNLQLSVTQNTNT
jgi:hypothetical protein